MVGGSWKIPLRFKVLNLLCAGKKAVWLWVKILCTPLSIRVHYNHSICIFSLQMLKIFSLVNAVPLDRTSFMFSLSGASQQTKLQWKIRHMVTRMSGLRTLCLVTSLYCYESEESGGKDKSGKVPPNPWTVLARVEWNCQLHAESKCKNASSWFVTQ